MYPRRDVLSAEDKLLLLDPQHNAGSPDVVANGLPAVFFGIHVLKPDGVIFVEYDVL